MAEGNRSRAAVAATPSAGEVPPPATVVIVPPGVTIRIRSLNVSAM
jgi:hypothetical protein